jgi:hypothetical protein
VKPGSALTGIIAAAVMCACSLQQPNLRAPVAPVAAHPLPFTGRLVSGDPNELPPAVAMSLSHVSNVTFTYREELTHDEYHIPLLLSAFDPVAYLGAPLGDYGATAFASLSVIDGDQVIGDYTAKSHVSMSYSFYSEPSHLVLDRAARTAVREKIDQQLYADTARLARAVGNDVAALGTPAVK